MPTTVPVAIIGGTGYTGLELIRILKTHPRVRLEAVTSRQYIGQPVATVAGVSVDARLVYEGMNLTAIARRSKAAFLCLPHHESMNVAFKLRRRGLRVIDLSADFRLRNPAIYETHYGPHTQKKLLKEAVYGMPEFYEAEIKQARLVASPGCYPTSIILGLAPLVTGQHIILEDIICDAKSGISGAGRTLKLNSLFCETNDSVEPYQVGCHRHTPEIEQELTRHAGSPVKVLFTPQLVPMDRGILATLYARPIKQWKTADLVAHYRRFYRKQPAIKILDAGQWPKTKQVRGTNECHIGLYYDDKTERVVIASAIDNLVKGASGQAIQSFNLMYGFDQFLGLKAGAWVV